MSRLFDRQLLQPDPPSLYDFLQTAVYTDASSPNIPRLRRLLSSPAAVRRARQVRPGGTGWAVQEIQHARVIAAEAVHHRLQDTPAPALFARLRHHCVLPQDEAMFIEAQKLRSMGPLSAFGWFVTRQADKDGHALQAALATEWGRGKLFSPLAVLHFALDGQGHYQREHGTDGPAIEIAMPEYPQQPGLLPSILEPILQGLMGTAATLLATLAVLNTGPLLPLTVPDQAQSAAHARRYGRSLVPYCKIPPTAPLLAEVGDARGKHL
ncbi:hypothetical protein AB0D37_43090 [Streptomyces sp. NPDC048384]|uniref:hypothetical protein n=1 Tax=Streptomyces sp. NPDC048384 TaxID=3155487 RepID=UPI00341BDC2D